MTQRIQCQPLIWDFSVRLNIFNYASKISGLRKGFMFWEARTLSDFAVNDNPDLVLFFWGISEAYFFWGVKDAVVCGAVSRPNGGQTGGLVATRLGAGVSHHHR